MNYRTEIDAPVDARWTWNYGSEVAELRSLYEKGKVNQWNASTDVDWDFRVSADDWLLTKEASLLAQVTALMGKDEATQKAAMFDEVGYLLSQLLHGEQAALQLCGQLTNVCDKLDEKYYAASQVIDEARHVEVFARLIEEKLGGIQPVAPTLKTLLDMLLEADTVPKKLLGMQTLFEGMAVGIMDLLRDECQNDLIKDVLRRVQQDEARHAAFGVLMMRRIVREISDEERGEMEEWAFSILEALNANQQYDMLSTVGAKYGILPEPVIAATTRLENFAEINSPIYMHTVIPNLRNLGLISDRTRSRWIETGMMLEN